MKVDNFVLLIISILTLIVISLLTECNRERLTELENKATKEIVETFFHLGSADPTSPGQWGYQITGITQGKYGGRSRQQVINKLLEVGSHNEGDYISDTEKDAYGSGLFDSNISGPEKNPVNCVIEEEDNKCVCLPLGIDSLGSNILGNNPLLDNLYKEMKYTPAQYGGTCSTDIDKFVYENDEYYKPMELSTIVNCTESQGLLPLIIILIKLNNDDCSLWYQDTQWCGYMSFNEFLKLKIYNDNSSFNIRSIRDKYNSARLVYNNKNTYRFSYGDENSYVYVNYLLLEINLSTLLYPEESIIIRDHPDDDDVDYDNMNYIWNDNTDYINDRYFVGRDYGDFNNLNNKGGENRVTLTSYHIPSHKHKFKVAKSEKSNEDRDWGMIANDTDNSINNSDKNRGANRLINDTTNTGLDDIVLNNEPQFVTKKSNILNNQTSLSSDDVDLPLRLEKMKEIINSNSLNLKLYNPIDNNINSEVQEIHKNILPKNTYIYSNNDISNDYFENKTDEFNNTFIKIYNTSEEGGNNELPPLTKTPKHTHNFVLRNDDFNSKGGDYDAGEIGWDDDGNDPIYNYKAVTEWGESNPVGHDNQPPFYTLALYKFNSIDSSNTNNNTSISSNISLTNLKIGIKNIIPIGTIIMNTSLNEGTIFDGSNGWLLCNGTSVNGIQTPDLTGRFIKIATNVNVNTIGETGGNKEVNLEFPKHKHKMKLWNDKYDGEGGDKNKGGLEREHGEGGNKVITPWPSSSYTGNGKLKNNIPQYYVVNYIMYVGVHN